MPEGITVRGIPEVQRNLANFPQVLVMNCFQKALSRAAAVFLIEVRSRTPETDYSTSSEEYGHLIDNLTDTIRIDAQGRGGTVRIHFGRKGFVALLVEYGHRMVTGGRFSKKGNGKGREVGSVPAHPFMRPAFEAAAERALEAFTETVREYMQSGAIAA